jgi:hypothetical protein
LVVAALAFALAMEWYWNYNVGCEYFRFTGDHLFQPPREPRTKGRHLLEFQQKNGFYQSAFVRGKTSGAIKRVDFVRANGAKQRLPFRRRAAR